MTAEGIIQILDELFKRLGIAVDWTTENIMPYITMAITEVSTTKQTLWMILMIIASIAFVTMLAFTIVHMCGGNFDYDYDDDVVFLLGIGISLVFLIFTVVNFVEWKCMPDIKAVKWILNAIKNTR